MRIVALVSLLEAARYDLERAMECMIRPGPMDARAMVDGLSDDAVVAADRADVAVRYFE